MAKPTQKQMDAVKKRRVASSLEALKRLGYTVYAWQEAAGEPMPQALVERIEIEAVKQVKQALQDEAHKRDQCNANVAMRIPDPVPVAAQKIADEVAQYSLAEGNSVLSMAVTLVKNKRKELLGHMERRQRNLEHEAQDMRAIVMAQRDGIDNMESAVLSGLANK